MNALRPPKKYRVTAPQYVRSGVFSLFLLGCYHLISWILYTFLLTTLENQMLGDEHEPQYRFVMFGFSLITLVALAAVSYVFYLKNGNRKRAFLAATSVEERPGEDVSDGYREYRHAAFYETVISTAITALVWLPSPSSTPPPWPPPAWAMGTPMPGSLSPSSWVSSACISPSRTLGWGASLDFCFWGLAATLAASTPTQPGIKIASVADPPLPFPLERRKL